jgi:hypothetical protein
VRADVDVDLVIDLLGGATTFRLLQGHAPLNARFADALVALVLSKGGEAAMIRPCGEATRDEIEAIVNDGGTGLSRRHPADCWHEPYMSREALDREIQAGVRFWAWEEDGTLSGVMGMQDVGTPR